MIRLIGIGILAFLLLVLEQRIYRKLWMRGLRVSICFQEECIFEGGEGTLAEVVENRKRLPLSMLKVKFQTSRNLIFDAEESSGTTDQYYRNDVFQIGGGERITRTLAFTGGKRGVYGIYKADLVAADLFLTSQMVDEASVNTTVYVYPKPYDSSEFRLSLRQLNGEVLARRHLLEDPFEYRGIREYQPFDDMRSINWKATARTGDFKVNQKNYTALRSVRIFMNLEDGGVRRKNDSVEASIRIAAGLCEYFLKEGIQVACYGNGLDARSGMPLSIDASAGRGQMSAVYRGLACIDADRVVPFARTFGAKLLGEAEGTITCFVSPNQYGDFVELIEKYQAAERDYVWFYPVEGSQAPELPGNLAGHIRVLPAYKV